MLFQNLDRIKRSAIMSTIVLMFIGLILLLIPESYFSFLSFILGFVFSVILVLSILNFIGETNKTLLSYIKLTLGLFSGIWSFAFFLFDGLLLSILSWVVGILPILLGTYGIYHAVAFARRSGRKAWWILIILSGFLILFGAMVFWNPWMDYSDAAIKVIGGALLYSSFVSAMSLIWIWPIKTGEETAI